MTVRAWAGWITCIIVIVAGIILDDKTLRDVAAIASVVIFALGEEK